MMWVSHQDSNHCMANHQPKSMISVGAPKEKRITTHRQNSTKREPFPNFGVNVEKTHLKPPPKIAILIRHGDQHLQQSIKASSKVNTSIVEIIRRKSCQTGFSKNTEQNRNWIFHNTLNLRHLSALWILMEFLTEKFSRKWPCHPCLLIW